MQWQVRSSSLTHVLVVNCVAGVAMSTSQEIQSAENVKPNVLHKSFLLETGSVQSKLQSKREFMLMQVNYRNSQSLHMFFKFAREG